MTTKLVGLGGNLRAGKDEVGNHLQANYGFKKMGMSDPLNAALLKLNPWIKLDFQIIIDKPWAHNLRRGRFMKGEYVTYQDLHEAVGYVEAKRHEDVRRLLQVLGTEVGREMFGPHVWVDIAEKSIKSLLDNGESVVITAVRFPNELEMIHRLGGTTVWIERPTEDREASQTQSQHASETSVSADMFDWWLNNNGTLEDLFHHVETLLGKQNEWDRKSIPVFGTPEKFPKISLNYPFTYDSTTNSLNFARE